MSFLDSLKSSVLKVLSPVSRRCSLKTGPEGEPGEVGQAYQITWITRQLAVGHAPTSYEELASIKGQGIDAIVNLCGEYCDLHRIEEEHGFEVLYLPVTDDCAPGMEDLEKALAWLDEAIYLGKKVLVHCKLGIGRTGTFVRSYLLRRGFGAKRAENKLKNIRSHPTSFNQWRFLRRFEKKEGVLNIRDPSLDFGRAADLDPFFAEYEALCSDADHSFTAYSSVHSEFPSCGKDTNNCCTQPFHLQLVEAITLNHRVNRELDRDLRLVVIDRARRMGRVSAGRQPGMEGIVLPVSTVLDNSAARAIGDPGSSEDYCCPLSLENKCLLYSHRPLRCRIFGMNDWGPMPAHVPGAAESPGEDARKSFSPERLNMQLFDISRRLFHALNGTFLEGRSLLFSMPRVLSGEFIQDYFAILSKLNTERE